MSLDPQPRKQRFSELNKYQLVYLWALALPTMVLVLLGRLAMLQIGRARCRSRTPGRPVRRRHRDLGRADPVRLRGPRWPASACLAGGPRGVPLPLELPGADQRRCARVHHGVPRLADAPDPRGAPEHHGADGHGRHPALPAGPAGRGGRPTTRHHPVGRVAAAPTREGLVGQRSAAAGRRGLRGRRSRSSSPSACPIGTRDRAHRSASRSRWPRMWRGRSVGTRAARWSVRHVLWRTGRLAMSW